MRPIVLMAAERTQDVRTPFDNDQCWFDGQTGLWKDHEGNLLVADAGELATTATATQEAMDQPDLLGFATTETRTQEGIDQSESSEFSTLLTETREATDQAEASMFATTITKTSEGTDQTERQTVDDLDYY